MLIDINVKLFSLAADVGGKLYRFSACEELAMKVTAMLYEVTCVIGRRFLPQ